MAASLRRVSLVGGSGKLGSHILKALQADSTLDVTVVTRTNSSNTFPPNSKIVKVSDGYPDNEMTDAFKGQHAVVLCLGFAAEQYHASLVDSSIKAGVKHLIASAYGGNDRSREAQELFPIAAQKGKIIAELKAREQPGWSWTAICCGLFFDFSLSMGFFGINPAEHKAIIWDSGDVKFSATNVPVIGQAVAKVLSKPEATANRSVYISSCETSMNEILEAYKKATGVTDWDVSHVKWDEEVAQGKEMMTSGNMWGMAKLALAVEVKEGFGADFAAEGLLDNELLDIPRDTVDATVARVMKGKL